MRNKGFSTIPIMSGRKSVGDIIKSWFTSQKTSVFYHRRRKSLTNFRCVIALQKGIFKYQHFTIRHILRGK